MPHSDPRHRFSPMSLIVVLVGLQLATVSLFAQGGARLVGTVRDQSGGVLPGATITVKNERTGEGRAVTTDDKGYYQVTALKASSYTIEASLPAFIPTQVTAVQLLVGQQSTTDIVLKPAGGTETITVVSSSDAGIDTSSARMGANVNPREVQSLPLNGRQISQLYLQAPGALNSGSGTFGDIRFSGRASEQNIIRYDGIEGTAIIDANPGNLNGEIPSPFRLQSSLENVQEFRVDSSNFPAEFGTGTGGQVSVVTKSGSNQFHGSVFEYLRNDAVDAPNFFDNIVGQKSPLRLNQFGGSIGGPIVKERSFFFFSYEGYRLRAGINSIEAVPGAQSRICEPAPGGAPCVEANGQASRTLALLPAFRDPKAQIIATGTGGNLFDVAQLQDNARVDENAVAARFDFKLSDTQSMYVRYFRDQGTNNQPEGVTGRRLAFTAVPQNAVVSLQSLLTQRVLNEFKLGYNGVYSRTNGAAPVINGIDISRLSINVSGNTANFSLPGKAPRPEPQVPGGLIRANSAFNTRRLPYTVYSLSFIDNLIWTRGITS